MVGGPEAAGGPDQLIKGILGLGKQIEQTLISFAQAMPNGAKYFQQANELIKQGIASEMSAAGGTGEQPPAGSPTDVGPQFPGGGFSSGGRP